MFLGHYAVALAVKPSTKSVSLGTLIFASQFIDLLWPILLLLGIERVAIVPGITRVTPLDFVHYPITHSLVGVLCWSVALGGGHFLLKKNRRNALIVGTLVFSHWILDLVMHRPDLPTGFGQTMLGLGLWDSYAGTLVVEGGIFLAAIALYLRATRHTDRIGLYALWSLLVVLAGIYLANLFGPPPPSVDAIGYSGLLLWLFVAWGYWIDRHRANAA